MKNLLPKTIAAQAMVLLVVGLAFTHLVSSVFYTTDRESALLTAGGEHAILWIATAGRFAETLSPREWSDIVASDTAEHRYVTLTSEPVVTRFSGHDWREVALQRELARHVSQDRTGAYRIAYASTAVQSPEMTYWGNYLEESGQDVPGEMIFVSLQLSNGNWLNAATPIETPPSFFSYRLGLSMIVMLVAVVLISFLIVGRMVAPLRQLSQAAEKLGKDVHAPAIPETGPEEVSRTARAFNTMQSRIRRFVEDRTQMLGAIAHDLGTPITRLRLRAEFVDDVELREKMLRDLDDMQQMVASTLSFIREDAVSEPQVSVDLGSLLTRVCDDINDAGGVVELDDVARWVLLDCRPTALRRALGNLIGNAVKYGSIARVSLQVEAEKLYIHIDDDGPGIPVERQEDVFQPFHRLEDSRNRETGGTGLGLAVARTIIRAHGGDISLANRPDGGLRVSVGLPRPSPRQDNSGSKQDELINPSTSAQDFESRGDFGPTQADSSIFNSDPSLSTYAMNQFGATETGMRLVLHKGRTTEWKTH